MKTRCLAAATALTLTMAAGAHAQSMPPGPGQPGYLPPQALAAIAAAQARTGQGAWPGQAATGVLGVAVHGASSEIQAQLGLPRGTGLVVDFVRDPAAAAGVKVYDVLTRLDDQILINGEQLGVLLRLYRGHDVTLGLLDRGQHQDVKVSLPHEPPAGAPVAAAPGPDIAAQLAFAMQGASSASATMPYLDVAVQRADEALRQQLNLPEGTGLTVRVGMAEPPPGIAASDVLTRLDDQVLVNPEQLNVLLWSHRAGDTVALTLVHAGQQKVVKVVLNGAPDQPQAMPGMVLPPGMPQPRAIIIAPKPIPTLPDGRPLAGIVGVPAAPVRMIITRIQPDGAWVQEYRSDPWRVELTRDKDGHRKLKVERGGKTVFDGSADTDQQEQAVPPEARAMLDEMQAMSAEDASRGKDKPAE